jgi:hypothetical protein
VRVTAFAPHLAGRMLPGLFSCDLKIGQRERFPGDPWPHFPPSPQLHWMHTTACTKDEHGCLHGLCRSKRMPRGFRADQTPSPQAAGIDRPSVGSMGTRQPADAGPLAGQRALFSEVAA